MGVYQYEIPGVIELENGAREAVVIHLYLKGLQTGDTVTFRGSMFAESAEWEWYNWGGTGLCQPQITANWWPRVYFRCAAAPAPSAGGRSWQGVPGGCGLAGRHELRDEQRLPAVWGCDQQTAAQSA
jgi:hypothetical protein